MVLDNSTKVINLVGLNARARILFASKLYGKGWAIILKRIPSLGSI